MDTYAIASLETKEVMSQQVIINGVPQGGVKQKVYFVKCGNCDRVIGQFNPGDPFVAVIDFINTNLSKDIVYCPTCGSKLWYTANIIDAEIKEVTTDEA